MNPSTWGDHNGPHNFDPHYVSDEEEQKMVEREQEERGERQLAALKKALSDLLAVSEAWYQAYCEANGATFVPHERGQTPVVVRAREALLDKITGR